MKIGILTFHNTTNYGAQLQCYALQKYIRTQGFCCEIIDYNNKYLTDLYSLNPMKSSSYKEFIKKLIYCFPEYLNKKSFLNFSKKYISTSKKSYNENNIAEADKEYDIFIAGSDQVWNYDLSGNDKNYFIMFSNDVKKRNSYAASIGHSILPDKYKDEIIENLRNQNNISLREKAGVNLVRQYIKDKSVVQCVDPVFLLEKKDWEIFIDKNLNKRKYIFVYEVARTSNLRLFAKHLSKMTGYEIVFLTKSSKNINGAKKLKYVSLNDFLSYIYNAEYIVTSSFHGLAFSIIFEKNVFYDYEGNGASFSSRLESLSEMAGLTSNKITPPFKETKLHNIDYNSVNKRINEEKEKSKQYLNNLLHISSRGEDHSNEKNN